MSAKSLFITAPTGSAEWVIQHAAWRQKRRRNPSTSFLGVANPRKALRFAQMAVKLRREMEFLALDARQMEFWALLTFKSDFMAFYYPNYERIIVDGWYPVVFKRRFLWKDQLDREMKAGDPRETPSMRIFREAAFFVQQALGSLELPMT